MARLRCGTTIGSSGPKRPGIVQTSSRGARRLQYRHRAPRDATPMSDPNDQFSASLDGFPVAADPEHFRAREPLEVLVSRFADAVRRGENPSIDEYAQRYGDWAEQIRELFPMIESLEHWKSNKEVECLRRSVPQDFPVR